MSKKLKILHLEDQHSDAELINMALKRGNLYFERLVVDTKVEFIQALKEFDPDIILSDHSLPSFNSYDALDIIHEQGLKIPFILITANVSEEFAVDVIKRGADDYILKDRIKRLPTAINNSIEKFRLEKERQNFLDEIIKNEKHYRALIENIYDAIILVNEKSVLIYQSPSTEHITGFTFLEMKNKLVFEQVHPDDKKYCLELFQQVSGQPGIPITNQYRILHKNGDYIWIEGTIINLLHD
jgi:PAS domain S-box-containing protein